MATKTLNPEQFKELATLGAPIAEVRDLVSDGLSFEDVKAIYEAQKQAKYADIKQQGQVNAQTAAELKRQDEKDKPHKKISVFSYPEGDVARPRPEFKVPKTFWLQDRLTHDLTTAEEIELLNQLVPGEYLYTKSDGVKRKVSVVAEFDAHTGKQTHMRVWFETRGDERHNQPPRVAMCREIIAQQKPDLVMA